MICRSLNANFISYSLLNGAGYLMLGGRDKIMITCQSDLVATAHMNSNGLYIMDFDLEQASRMFETFDIPALPSTDANRKILEAPERTGHTRLKRQKEIRTNFNANQNT